MAYAPNWVPSCTRTNESHEGESAEEQYDVIVVGAGWAGIGAAIGAKQAAPSARVLVLESQSCSGAPQHTGACSRCAKKAVAGVWDELHGKLLARRVVSKERVSHRGTFWIVEPEGLKVCLDELLAEHDISALLHCTVVGADRSSDNSITSAEVQDRRGGRKIHAKAFDCSGECDLAYFGRASARYGNLGKVNLGSLSTRFGGLQNVSPTAEQWKAAIIAVKEARPELKKLIPKDSSVILRLPLSGDIVTYLASASYDARSSATTAEQQGRRQAEEYLRILRKLPGHENMYRVSTGPNFGTRESRHIDARYQLQVDDVLKGRHFPDTIAIGGWGLESHDSTKKNWASEFRLPDDGCFEVPLGCLWSVNTANLFEAGRCVHGDQYAGRAARVLDCDGHGAGCWCGGWVDGFIEEGA